MQEKLDPLLFFNVIFFLENFLIFPVQENRLKELKSQISNPKLYLFLSRVSKFVDARADLNFKDHHVYIICYLCEH